MTTLSAIRQLQLREATRKRAAADRRIRGAPFLLLMHLSDELDDDAYKAKKTKVVARELHLELPTVARALRRLVAAGYLERGAKIDRVWSYRLKWQGETVTEMAG